ncbi:MAG: hypothetical protein IBX55_08820 [Methyloprofundus sp.]|nr:hypothetical protein [Methyloprofundus sp.]
MSISPEQLLQQLRSFEAALREAKTKEVAVGVIGNTTSVYQHGQNVLDVAGAHEFGKGRMPARSFLRMPFNNKRNEIDAAILTQFRRVADGRASVQQALGLVGVTARNISIEAFETGGFGQWQDISAETKATKGSDTILWDTGKLVGSVTWAVRDAT